MTWDEDDRLRSTAPNAGGTPQATYYAYDAGGQRVRKVTAGQGPGTGHRGRADLPRRLEVYREYDTDRHHDHPGRETLHVSRWRAADRAGRRPAPTEPTRAPHQLVRYQHSNHLGSAVLELDDAANIISYEEYFPYGSTSYQAVTAADRDPEAVSLHRQGTRRGKRPVLPRRPLLRPLAGEVVSADPAGLIDGTNQYSYARNKAVGNVNRSGLAAADFDKITANARLMAEKCQSWRPHGNRPT